MSWRDRARPIIAEVIRHVGRSDIKLLRKEISAAYPFGARKYHPYKIWLSEIKNQIGRDNSIDGQGDLFGS